MSTVLTSDKNAVLAKQPLEKILSQDQRMNDSILKLKIIFVHSTIELS